MEIKQNPFSLYDFLGYFVPGSLFLMGIGVIPFLSSSPEKIIGEMISFFQLDKPGFYFPFILAAYLTGHILSFLSTVTLENYSVWSVGYPSKYLLGEEYPKYLKPSKPEHEYPRKITRIFVFGFLLPITIWDCTLGKAFNLRELLYARRLEPELAEIINGKLKKLAVSYTGLKANKINPHDSGIFRFAYHYASEKTSVHFPKMQNYVALYGFTRTITMVIVLWFWLISFSPALLNIKLLCVPVSPVLFSFIAYISFLNFMKFYRRFSLEVLMAISVIV